MRNYRLCDTLPQRGYDGAILAPCIHNVTWFVALTAHGHGGGLHNSFLSGFGVEIATLYYSLTSANF